VVPADIRRIRRLSLAPPSLPAKCLIHHYNVSVSFPLLCRRLFRNYWYVLANYGFRLFVVAAGRPLPASSLVYLKDQHDLLDVLDVFVMLIGDDSRRIDEIGLALVL
jgi:hypothetical protein